jgi:hypothetical protein
MHSPHSGEVLIIIFRREVGGSRADVCSVLQVEESKVETEAVLQEKAVAHAQVQDELEALKATCAAQTAEMQRTASHLQTERSAFDARCKELVEAEAARVRAEEARAMQCALDAVRAAHEREIRRVKEDAEQMYASKVTRLRDEVVGIFSYENDGTSRTVSQSAHVDVSPYDQC